ncbi:hypothetical protein OB955_08790 [Halobacteria archaeon AArc-m2/3/4]|uniref:Uncharacterized protein n=1 Tax=Natronoglomus mannanivorans TaxID=2979990 RepID=A0AAP2Z3B7_9EURY|nr:hypothetical protein [Halobacteria archaeon AArc-xg1-1]MCU4972836.1 hypothetical protein [Halobacteria archaeon AArc-m2/3/4]
MEYPESDTLEALFEDGRVNAAISWLLVGFLGLVFLESLLDFDLLWIVFTAVTAAVVLLPPLYRGSLYVMLPWEVLVLALFPITARALELGELSTFASYLSLAALALLIVVELHILQQVQVTHWFAILSVVMATLAAGGAWAIIRWNLDNWYGTSYLTTNEALMVEFAWITLAGLAAGVVFDLYFRRRTGRLRQTLGWVIRR